MRSHGLNFQTFREWKKKKKENIKTYLKIKWQVFIPYPHAKNWRVFFPKTRLLNCPCCWKIIISVYWEADQKFSIKAGAQIFEKIVSSCTQISASNKLAAVRTSVRRLSKCLTHRLVEVPSLSRMKVHSNHQTIFLNSANYSLPFL